MSAQHLLSPGMRIGTFTLLERAPASCSKPRWFCVCDCGVKIIRHACCFHNGGTVRCRECSPQSSDIWPQERKDELRRLWLEGHSSKEIGRKLGITKNAVIGQARRLKLPPRPSPIIRGGAPRQYVHRAPAQTLPKLPSVARVDNNVVAIRRPSVVAPTPMLRPVLGHPQPVSSTPHYVGAKQPCCWILNDSKPYLYCEAPSVGPERSWCPNHRALVYLPRRHVAA